MEENNSSQKLIKVYKTILNLDNVCVVLNSRGGINEILFYWGVFKINRKSLIDFKRLG